MYVLRLCIVRLKIFVNLVKRLRGLAIKVYSSD
jgi:hypothetical protein